MAKPHQIRLGDFVLVVPDAVLKKHGNLEKLVGENRADIQELIKIFQEILKSKELPNDQPTNRE